MKTVKKLKVKLTLCKNCPHSEFFWSAFSRIQTEYGDTPYSVGM